MVLVSETVSRLLKTNAYFLRWVFFQTGPVHTLQIGLQPVIGFIPVIFGPIGVVKWFPLYNVAHQYHRRVFTRMKHYLVERICRPPKFYYVIIFVLALA